jgi:small subunit ribosomal protein S5
MSEARAQSGPGQPQEEKEWQERIIQIRRVTKVVKGGKKMSFRAVVVVGNGKGQVGLGLGKSNEVIGAIQKGVADAKKNLITVSMFKATVPHQARGISGASTVIVRPASEGTGVIAGGAVRSIVELAGIKDVLCKSLGSNSPLNVARAAIAGLEQMRTFKEIADARGIAVKDMLGLK